MVRFTDKKTMVLIVKHVNHEVKKLGHQVKTRSSEVKILVTGGQKLGYHKLKKIMTGQKPGQQVKTML